MSELNNAVFRGKGASERADPWSGLKARWKWYVAATIVLAIVLAWIDGGEEPLRPIVQNVSVSEGA